MSKRLAGELSLPGIVALLFLFATAQGAQAGWLPPVDVSDAGEHIGDPQVVLDSGGHATAVWSRGNGTETVVESSFRIAGQAWQKPVVVGPGDLPQIAVDGDGDTTLVWESYAGTNRILIESAYRPVGENWEEPVDVGEVKTMIAPEPSVGVGVDGDATVTWNDQTVIRSAYRPAGGSWQEPTAISDPELESYVPQLAVDADGNATAVWNQEGGSPGFYSAYREAGGGWETPMLVSEPGESTGNASIALDTSGNIAVVWNGEDEGSRVIRAAFRPVDEEWQPPESVSAPGNTFVSWPQVALDADGNAIAAWGYSSSEPGGYVIAEAAYRPAGGGWEAPTELSEDGANAYPEDLAFDVSGNAAVVWQRNNIIQAAYRPTEGAWEAPTDLSKNGLHAMDASVVLGAPGSATNAHGNATAVWTKVDEGNDYTVQAAGYNVHGPPSEQIEVPETGSVGASVEVTMPPVDAWSPELDFGDGTQVAASSATHVYAEPGEYDVSFASTDVLGYRAVAHRTIAIGPAEESPDPDPDPESPDPDPESAGSPSPLASVPGPVPAGDSPENCVMAQAARKEALHLLRSTQARLRRARFSAEAQKLRHRVRRQASALRRARDRVDRAC
jgi:PKD domain